MSTAPEELKQETEALLWGVMEKKHNYVRDRIKAGADVNATNKEGLAPLHLAASEGQKAILKLLIRAKADVDARDKDGNVALHYAVISRDCDCVELLIQSKADTHAKNTQGKTPRDLAVRDRKVFPHVLAVFDRAALEG